MKILYSIAHGPADQQAHVVLDSGLTEYANAKIIGEEMQSVSAALGDELIIYGNNPVTNWSKINIEREKDPGSLALEIHLNAVPKGYDPKHWRLGHVIQNNAGDESTLGLCEDIRSALSTAMPFSRSVDIVRQPDPNYPNWAFFRNVRPARSVVLIELGYKQDPIFCKYINDDYNKRQLAAIISQTIYCWGKERQS